MKIEVRYFDQTYSVEITGREGEFEIRIGDQVFPVTVLSRTQERWTLEIGGQIHDVLVAEKEGQTVVDWQSQTFALEVYSLKDRLLHQAGEFELAGRVPLKAQMPGRVISVLAHEGDQVESGQGLVIIEAMKMQNELKSPKRGTVVTCSIQEDAAVSPGQLLFEIE